MVSSAGLNRSNEFNQHPSHNHHQKEHHNRMSTSPTPLSAADIQQMFNVAYVKQFPGQFYETNPGMVSKSPTAIFALETQEEHLVLVNMLTIEQRRTRFQQFIIDGYGPIMLARTCNIGEDPYTVLKALSDDGVKWMPPAALPGSRLIQPELGEPGQYALPGAFEAGVNIGAYPETMPDNWVKVPPVSELLAAGADVPALLHSWYGGAA